MKPTLFRLIFAFTIGLIITIYAIIQPKELANVQGGCSDKSSPYMKNYFTDNRKITYCTGGDSYKGEILSEKFKGQKNISFWYAGYPNNNSINLSLMHENNIIEKIILPDAGEVWVKASINIPEVYLNKFLQLKLIDDSADTFGWAGISFIENNIISQKIKYLLFSFFLIFLILITFSVILHLLLLRFELENALPLMLVLFGMIGYLIFYIYLINPNFGKLISILFFIFIFFSTSKICIKGDQILFTRSIKIIFPLITISSFIVFIGYYPQMNTEQNSSWQIAANRWLNLPIDNWLPKIFGDQIFINELKRPMIGDWYSSDRPPLQTGMYLLFNPINPGNDLLYQIISTFAQATVLIPIWLILNKINGKINYRPFIFVFSFSSLFIVNSLFVWPKLLSASFVLIFLYYIHFCNSKNLRNFMIGTSASLAMLSHGGAIFALLAISILWLIFNIKHRSKEILKDYSFWLLLFLVIMLPWMYYGKYIDPQYSRLAKWHLLGLIPPSDISLINAFKITFNNLNFDDWVLGRMVNLSTITNGFIFLDIYRTFGEYSNFVKHSLNSSFFKFFYSMWFFSPFIAIPMWFLWGAKWISSEVIFIILSSIVCMFIWLILMFIPGSSIIHQGSYYMWIALFLCCQYLIFISSRKLFYFLSLMNLISAFSLYILNPLSLSLDFVYISTTILLISLFWKSLNYWRINDY
jgi:hypothetical protein